MAISVESTSTRIILNIGSTDTVALQRAFYKDRTWFTWTENGFVNLEESTESLEPKGVEPGDFVDSFSLNDGLYEYRFIALSDYEKYKDEGNKWEYSHWIKYGSPECIGYSFNNYSAPEGKWGTVVTTDDCRYTYLWGTDFKATNGQFFDDEQIQYFIDEAVAYMERELNITIKKRVIRCDAKNRGLKKTTKTEQGDYTDEESYYDFSKRKIQRYGMITTAQRPIIDVQKLELIHRGGTKENLLDSTIVDRKKGILKFLKRPWLNSQRNDAIHDAIAMYGAETFNPHLFYAIDYTAGYENSDEIPADLRAMIGKVAAISLLNVIGDGLMSGFSSSSLSMDGISESFSSTQSATSGYFGSRIMNYKEDVKNYITENKYKFGYVPIGSL